jgi:hypothetical protein
MFPLNSTKTIQPNERSEMTMKKTFSCNFNGIHSNMENDFFTNNGVKKKVEKLVWCAEEKLKVLLDFFLLQHARSRLFLSGKRIKSSLKSGLL